MIALIFFIFGLFIGSFLGVLTDRLPKKEQIISGRSHCDNCKKPLKWYDLIPVISFVLLSGECRYCNTKLSFFYPVIEIITGIIFLLTYLAFPYYLFTLIFYLVIASSFIVIFFTDLKYGIIPNNIILFSVILTFVWLIFHPLPFIMSHIVSGIVAFLIFIVIPYSYYLIRKRESMGGGDIKLSFLMGLFLGFPQILIAIYTAFLTGAVMSIILIVWKKKDFQKDTVPFGPFLVLGTFVSLFLGDFIFARVVSFLGI